MAFQVRTILRPSPIEGLGVFAAEPIAKGTVTWRYDPAIDRSYSPAEIAAMPDVLRAFMDRYAYLDDLLGVYILCGDDGRFMNHADTPTVLGLHPADERPEGIDVAARDIAAGEELTCDYRSFDIEATQKLGG
jgi:uncharacterized protein